MTLAQARKAVVSLVVAGAAAAALFIVFDPNLTQALVTLVGAAFGVIGVFATKNATQDDWSKAAAELQAAALSVVGFFVSVPTDTPEKITAVVVALIASYFVFRIPNEPAAE